MRAVERMLLQFKPSALIRAEVARRFSMSERSIHDYIEIAWQRIESAEDPKRERRRMQARITAQSQCAKCLASSDKMHGEAMRLLADARRLDGPARAVIEATLADDAEDAPEDDDAGEGQPKVPPAVKKARSKMVLANRYRNTALGLLARAEQWNARAESWFDKAARIAGVYEIEAAGDGRGGENSMRGLTSAQRRERTSAALTALRVKLDARKAAVQAARAPA
jgi:hypothetical protein